MCVCKYMFYVCVCFDSAGQQAMILQLITVMVIAHVL